MLMLRNFIEWWNHIFDKPDAYVALFTALLSISTTALWWSTRKLWKAGDAQIAVAKQSADAATKTARAVIGLQLPIIRMQPDPLGHGDSVVGDVRTEECFVYSITLSNLGPTKAFPKEILYDWWIGDGLPSEPKYEFSDKFSINSILEPDPKTTITQRLTMTKMLEGGQWSDICRGNRLWFYCAILYDDFMGENHSHGFCWRWASTGMDVDWRADAAPAYNRKT